MRVKKWDIVICVVIGLFLLPFAIDLQNTVPVARVYPMVVLGGSYLLLAILIIRWIIAKKKAEPLPENEIDFKRNVYIVIYCAAILMYIFLIEKLGFMVSTVAFGIYSLVYMKNKSKLVVILMPIIVTVVLYFIFTNFLMVTLPSGILK